MEHEGHTSYKVCSETKFTFYKIPKQELEFKIAMTKYFDEAKRGEYSLPRLETSSLAHREGCHF